MTPENASAVGPQPAGMGDASRITGVFFEPKKTFADIAQRPSWLLPMVLLILAGIGFVTALSQHVGWDRVVNQQLSMSKRVQEMPKDQRDQAAALQVRFAPVTYYGGAILVTPIMSVVVAAVLLGITAIMSAGLRFSQVFAIVSWGFLPGVLKSILTVVVIFLKNPDDFNIRSPLAFNAGALMDPNGPSKFLYSLATALDLFTLWTILLFATGLKVAAGKRLSFTGALVAVVVPWLLLVLLGAAIAAAFT